MSGRSVFSSGPQSVDEFGPLGRLANRAGIVGQPRACVLVTRRQILDRWRQTTRRILKFQPSCRRHPKLAGQALHSRRNSNGFEAGPSRPRSRGPLTVVGRVLERAMPASLDDSLPCIIIPSPKQRPRW